MTTEEKTLLVAACYDNKSYIEDYLASWDDTTIDGLPLESRDVILAKALHKAAESCSVKVVETLVNSPHVDVTCVNADSGWNALHYAASAVLKESFAPATNYKGLRRLIYVLFKKGTDPTVQDLIGRTPLKLVLSSRFDRIKALFELLQKIWNGRLTDNVETDTVPVFSVYIHKELLQWAIELDFEEMVQQILLMYPKLSCNSWSEAAKASEARRNLLLGLKEDGWSAFHLATEQKCVNAFRALLTYSGFPLTEIVNFCPKGSEQRRGEKVTPLSSILINSKLDSNPLMDVLIEFHKNYRQYGNFPITNVNLSYAYVGEMLSPIIFKLEGIITLKGSNMQLNKLPFHKLSHYPLLLTHLDVSSNNLNCLPEELFTCLHLDFLNVSNNPLGCLPKNWWKSRSLRRFWASSVNLKEIFSTTFSSELSSSLVDSQGYAKPAVYHRPIKEISHLAVFEDEKVSKLRNLDLSNNDITEFPHCFACVFPQLENLNLSKNKLPGVCYIQELPVALARLDLSYNWLSSSEMVPFAISTAGNCFASQNAFACGHMLHCELPRLHDLFLSHNRYLYKLNFTCLPSDNLLFSLHENDDNTEHVFFPNLTRLEVNDCRLQELPCRLDLMSKLRSLDMSDNPIRNIPFEICHLEKLEEFKYKNIFDELTYELNQRKTVTEKRYFLKFHKEGTVSDPSVRLMFVGLSGRGKSTLLRHLRWVGRVATIPVGWRDRMEQENCGVQHTIGVDQDVWYYTRSQDEPVRQGSYRQKIITFYTWDFAGQEEYYATHQCYLTRKALYVVCWRVTDGTKGVMELKEWLLSIQAKAKDAVVVIVGTHVDMIVCKQRIQVCEDLHKLIQTNYCSGSPYYPDIKGIKFVSCLGNNGQRRTEFQPIIELRKHLYDIASSMMVTLDSRYPKLKLIDQEVPRKYKTLQEFIFVEASSMKRHKQPPIVKFIDLQKKLQSVGELRAMDKLELFYGLQYLKDNGLLLHFDSGILAEYYFIDPQWFCDVLAVIVSPLPQINEFVAYNGNITTKQFYSALTKYGVTSVNIELLLKLLCKFEIVIKLNADSVLIPALLDDSEGDRRTTHFQPFRFPPKEAINFGNINLIPEQKLYLCSNKSCYRRLFMAPHIPVSFWPRFISRCLSSKYFCRMLVSCGKNVTVKDCLTVNQAIVDGTLFQWQYGKEKIHLLFGNHVLLRVNKIGDELSNGRIKYTDHFSGTRFECHYREGFIVHVPGYSVVTVNDTDNEFVCTKTFSAQILAHVLELIDQVMRDWFEGLLDRGIYSDDFLLQLIPCPYCFGDQHTGSVGSASSEHSDYNMGNDVICFSVGFCLQKVQEMNGVECPQCQSELMIKHIAPDLEFDDLTPNFKIDSQLLTHKKFINKGGYGQVDRMMLLKNLDHSTGQMVAVKTIAASEENHAISYGLTRIELNKLLSADHPNVLRFIGITVTPPAIVVEYAPLGSLHDVTKQYREKGCPICPASIAMILQQIGGALAYLHGDRYIVHCDVKPSNILVFAFPDADHKCISTELIHSTLQCTACENGSGVLVKLADLGTACYIGPEGFSKRPTTPGHNAPEDILYLGKEFLTEKVDIFSLGTTLFELMTHRDLPGIVHDVDFSREIKHGRRPRFLPTDPKYPSIFNECLFSCWSQDYRHRPSATDVAQVFQPPHNISFLHSYPISRNPQGSCLVVSGDDSQYIWIVNKDGCSVVVGKFMESESIPAFDLIFSEILCFKDNPVKILSQIGEKLWAVVKDGRIAICNIDCKNEELFYMQTKGFPIDAKEPIKICSISTNTVMLAYSNGLLVFATHQDLSPNSRNSPLFMSISLHMNKLNCIQVIQCQLTLHDVEVISCAKELWCGCDNGLIQIFEYSIYSNKGVIKPQSHSSLLPQNSAIVQLKSHSFTTLGEMVVFALHHPGNIISCWEAKQQNLLKVIPLKFQASAILPLASSLFMGTMCGRVLVYKFTEEKLTQLTGRHKQGEKVLTLAAVNGKVTKNWLISSIGKIVSSTTGNQSMSQDDEDLPCDVLLSLGSGYHEVFDSHLGEEGFQRVLTWCILK